MLRLCHPQIIVVIWMFRRLCVCVCVRISAERLSVSAVYNLLEGETGTHVLN